MSLRFTLAAATLALSAAPAFAGGHTPALYPYNASANYCPAGTQPIVLGGVICCGVPNQHVTYSSMMQHPAPTRHYRGVSPTYFDNPGVKGTGG